MKLYGLVLLLAVASCHGALIERTGRSKTETGLATMVEAIRETLITGSDKLGIPAMEPYVTDSFDLDVDNALATLTGELTDLTVSGFTGFEVSSLTVTKSGDKVLIFDYTISWPKITVSSKYSIEGTVAGTSVAGSGDLSAEVTNLNVTGTVMVSHLGTGTVVGALTFLSTSNVVELGEGDLAFEITGLNDDEEWSATVSATVSEKGPQLVEQYSTTISRRLNNFILDVGSDLVSTTFWNTLYDLLFDD